MPDLDVWPPYPTSDATARDARLVLALDTGRVLHTYTLPGGKFSFQNVPAGKHYLDVELVGLVFPTLEVTVEESGDVHALSVDLSGRPPAAIPLTLKPVGKIDFFEVWALCVSGMVVQYWQGAAGVP